MKMAGYSVFDRFFAFQINPSLKIVSLIFLFVITSLQECFVHLPASYIVNLVLRILASIFRCRISAEFIKFKPTEKNDGQRAHRSAYDREHNKAA